MIKGIHHISTECGNPEDIDKGLQGVGRTLMLIQLHTVPFIFWM